MSEEKTIQLEVTLTLPEAVARESTAVRTLRISTRRRKKATPSRYNRATSTKASAVGDSLVSGTCGSPALNKF